MMYSIVINDYHLLNIYSLQCSGHAGTSNKSLLNGGLNVLRISPFICIPSVNLINKRQNNIVLGRHHDAHSTDERSEAEREVRPLS